MLTRETLDARERAVGAVEHYQGAISRKTLESPWADVLLPQLQLPPTPVARALGSIKTEQLPPQSHHGTMENPSDARVTLAGSVLDTTRPLCLPEFLALADFSEGLGAVH